METFAGELHEFVGENVVCVLVSGVRVNGTLLDVASNYVVVRANNWMHRVQIQHIANFITECQPEEGI